MRLAGDGLDRVRAALSLLLDRRGATLADLRGQLTAVQAEVATWPLEIRWPDDVEVVSTSAAWSSQVAAQWSELGFYDAGSGRSFEAGTTCQDIPSEIGDAVDDLTDIAGDLAQALALAQRDAVGARNLLRFTMDTHWGEHVRDLVRHLDTRIGR